jgi:hypothetical protein
MKEFLPDDARQTVLCRIPRRGRRDLNRSHRYRPSLGLRRRRYALAPQLFDTGADRREIIGGAGSDHVSSVRSWFWVGLSGDG